jgi:hypothetical protein
MKRGKIMSGKWSVSFAIVLALSLYCAGQAFSEEQCIARYDTESNVLLIPCVAIGEQQIWVNFRLNSPEQLQFGVERFGANFLPLWLTQTIVAFVNAPVANPPRRIIQYRYNENAVYYISSPCCDQFNYLYDAAGNIICAPDGGLTGNGDGQCPDFAATAINAVVVWEDERKLE